MGIQHEILIRSDHVRVLCEGAYVLIDFLQVIQTALETATRAHLTKILFDCRKLQGQLTITQRYDLGAQGAALYTKTLESGCILMVMLGNEPLIDPRRFAEVVANNRGVPVKATTDLQEALNWLQLQSGEL